MLKSCLGSVSRGLNNGDMGKCISEIPKLGTKYTKFPLINAPYLQQSLHISEYCDQNPKPANANYPFLFVVAGIPSEAVLSFCCLEVTCLHKTVNL